MTELPAGLDVFRTQLRDAVARDLDRSRRSSTARRRGARIVAPLLAAGTATAIVLAALPGGAPVQSADAAILRHVDAALHAPAATILHERALVTAGSRTTHFELWIETAPPYHYHVIKWGHQGTGVGGSFYDLAATLRSLIESGRASVASATTFAGLPAYELHITGNRHRFLDGTVYVSRSTYHPLMIDTTAVGGEQIRFEAYQYLRATPANLRLLGIR